MNRVLFIICLFFNTLIYCQSICQISKEQLTDGAFIINSEDKTSLSSKKVIGLGESTHNMGSTIAAKIAMIKYLHDSLGFNTLAIESSIYDCYVLNKLFELGKATETDFFDAIFGVWKSEEMRKLYQYIVSTYQTDNPIKLAGIDNQFTDLSAKYLVKDIQILEDSIRQYDSTFKLSERFYSLLKDEIKYSNYFKKFAPEDTLDFVNQLNKLENAIELLSKKTSYFDFWKQIPLNLKTDFTRRYHKPYGNLRDSVMAINLINYYELNQHDKIIIWAATYHLVNNIRRVKSSWYQNSVVCGEYLKKYFVNDYYVMAFSSYTGTYGSEKGLFNVKLKKLSQNSIEWKLYSTYQSDFIFMDLRKDSNQDFLSTSKYKSARILGNREFEMDINNICDGIFIIRNSTGVTSLKVD